MTQKERVIDYINTFGSISPMEAFMDLGVTKLATVIGCLKREDGLKVYQRFIKTENRYGEIVYYMRYWLKEDLFNKFNEMVKC